MANLPNALPDPADTDPQETREWIDALEGVINHEGPTRAHYLIEKAHRPGPPARAWTSPTRPIPNTSTPFRSTSSPSTRAMPDMEIKIHSYIRWNAMAMVVRANKDTNVGGHIASFASAAALYDVGFSHFWNAPSTMKHGGDLIFFQGHSVPGVYSRAFMLGRLTEEQMDSFRQETGGKGISSYPHPWLMPDFWQFPTVSMGLGPIQAIYQARFMKYLGQPRPDRRRQGRAAQGLGLPRRRRDRRGRIAGRHRHGRPREAGQPDLRHQLQPAAPRRPGARQRQDHPGTRIRIPRRRLERHQADLGHPLGRPVPARQEAASSRSA